ncbi:hypothetical protein [Ruminococcus sp.]|uniref:hypothetical protein n=1 Tax=Ruminococcus TaxID=1263 RepID=UPI0025D7AE29|nr:hypothetical protein [uncultured Ruminococcus sp.]
MSTETNLQLNSCQRIVLTSVVLPKSSVVVFAMTPSLLTYNFPSSSVPVVIAFV